jgi:hypothetical protein
VRQQNQERIIDHFASATRRRTAARAEASASVTDAADIAAG